MSDSGKPSCLSPELLERIQEILQNCTENEATVLRLRFGMEDGKFRTLEETAERLGVSRERVRQIENKVMHRQAGARRVKKIKDFYC